jgi:hypothetical protein
MGTKSDILRILQAELDKLHDSARDTKDTSRLLMSAHSIGVVQNIRDRIKEEIADDSR